MRVALVGLGNAASTLHLPALRGIGSAVVVGGCDLDADRRSQIAKEWSAPVFEDFEAMLRHSNPEVVVVGTPPSSHAEQCIVALEAGAHVICEKPFVSASRRPTG